MNIYVYIHIYSSMGRVLPANGVTRAVERASCNSTNKLGALRKKWEDGVGY